MKQPCVYILQSLKNSRYYVGSTDEIERRIKKHNLGKVKATCLLRPLELKIFIPCLTLKEARQSEYRLKKYKRKDIIEKVIKSKTFPWQYKPTSCGDVAQLG